MEYTFERINPYRLTFDEVRQWSDTALSGFRNDHLHAARLGLPKDGSVPIYHRIVLELLFWPRLLRTDRLNYVVRHGTKIIALSSWACPNLSFHDHPSWYLRLRRLVTDKTVEVLSKIVFNLFAVLGLSPHPNRKEVIMLAEAFRDGLPRPKDCDAFLEEMAVREDYQRKGLGGKLLQYGIDNINEYCAMDGRKPPRMALHASPSGEGMYARFDFKPIDSMEVGIGSAKRNSTLMIRDRQL